MKYRISIVGAGRVATHLAMALNQAGHVIGGVYSRTQASALSLSSQLPLCKCCSNIEDLPEADIYIFSISDQALPEVLSQFSKLGRIGLCLHTAGSISLDIFREIGLRGGIMYPLQTFTKGRRLDFNIIPLFLETTDKNDSDMLMDVASSISSEVRFLDSSQRRKLHLAAVFACNFTNHCYAVACHILSEHNLPSKLLEPLFDETCHKLHDLSAIEAQTGPAVRYDKNVMEAQIKQLCDDPLRMRIYEAMSESIHDYAIDVKL